MSLEEWHPSPFSFVMQIMFHPSSSFIPPRFLSWAELGCTAACHDAHPSAALRGYRSSLRRVVVAAICLYAANLIS